MSELSVRARTLCRHLERHDWNFRQAAEARGVEPRRLYREWLESLGWNQSLAARLYRRDGKPVTRQAIEAQMKTLGVVRPIDLPKLLKDQDLEGGVEALRAVHDFIRDNASMERLCCEQLIALADTYERLGATAQARAALVEVIRIARSTRAADVVSRAIRPLSRFGYSVRRYGEYDPHLVELLEGWLPAMYEADDQEALSWVLGLLAVETYPAPRPEARERARGLADEALAAAETCASPNAMTAALGAWVLTRSDPEQLRGRLEMLERVASRVEPDGALRYLLTSLVLSDRLEAGQLDGVGPLEEELRQLEGASYAPWPERYRASLCVMRGEWREVDRLASSVGSLPPTSAAQIRGVQQYEVMRLRGEWSALVGLVRWNANQEPEFVGWQVSLAVVSALLGQTDGLSEQLEAWAADDFAVVPKDFMRVTTLCQMAELCAAANHSSVAAKLHAELAPFGDRICVLRVCAAVLGSVSRYLGILSHTLGEWERATEEFETALSVNERLGAKPYLVCTRYDYARMLMDEGRHEEKARSLLRTAAHEAARLEMPWLATRADALLAERRDRP